MVDVCATLGGQGTVVAVRAHHDVGVPIAVHVESGDTSAYLDGDANVSGNVNVTADQAKEDFFDLQGKLFPTNQKGVLATTIIGTKSTGNFLQDSATSLQGKASAAFAGTKPGKSVQNLGKKFGQKVSNVFGGGGPGTSRPTWQVGAAIAFNYDNNTVDARIGDGGTDSRANIEADGSLFVTATVDSRPDVKQGGQDGRWCQGPGRRKSKGRLRGHCSGYLDQ